jgi:hypothetical protein
MKQDKLNLKPVALAFFAFLTLMLAGLAYPRGEFVLVVAMPGSDQRDMMAIISRAGAAYVAPGQLGWLAIAHADTPDLTHRLLQAGAIMVVDHALAAGCSERT